MLRKIILVLVLIASLSKAGGKVTVSVEMDSTVILIGQQAHIALKVVADSQQNITFPVFPQKQIIPCVEVIEEKITGTEELNDGRQKSITKIYTITSFDSTLYYIPPFKVRVDNKTYDSKSLALKVETMDVDTLHLDKFFGPKEIADVPFSWKDWRGLFYLSLLLILLLGVFSYIAIQLHNNKPLIRKFRIKPSLPAHQWAMSEIQKINKQKDISEDTKEYYTKLTDILRSYIQKRYGFNAKEMTSSEIIEKLKLLDKKSIEELQQLFQTADLVKFAKFRTMLNENDENLLRAMDFIKATKLEVQEKPQKPVEIAPEVQRTRRSRLILKIVNVCLLIASLAILFYIGRALYLMSI